MRRILIVIDHSAHDLQVWAHSFIIELSDTDLYVDKGEWELNDSIGFTILSKKLYSLHICSLIGHYHKYKNYETIAYFFNILCQLYCFIVMLFLALLHTNFKNIGFCFFSVQKEKQSCSFYFFCVCDICY